METFGVKQFKRHEIHWDLQDWVFGLRISFNRYVICFESLCFSLIIKRKL